MRGFSASLASLDVGSSPDPYATGRRPSLFNPHYSIRIIQFATGADQRIAVNRRGNEVNIERLSQTRRRITIAQSGREELNFHGSGEWEP
jgi:hypothetical protein